MNNHRFPILTVLIAGVAVLVQSWPGAAEALQFERGLRGPGEAWRLVTAHLAHFDWNHLRWDGAVLLALGAVCERESRRRCAAALALAAPAITIAVGLAAPQFATYRGLSGLDCALFGLLSGSLLQREAPLAKLAGSLALMAVLAKSAWEMANGVTLFANGAGYAPVPLAHLVGAVVGFGTALATRSAPSSATPVTTEPDASRRARGGTS